MVDHLVDVLKIIDTPSSVVQVIDVPKIISQDSIPQRTLLSEPQLLVEQLVGRASAAGGHPGTRQGRSWQCMVPAHCTAGDLLVAVGHTAHPVVPPRRGSPPAKGGINTRHHHNWVGASATDSGADRGGGGG